MTDKTFKDYLKEDSVDMEKHNTLNDIFQALEQLNTEVDELDALDSCLLYTSPSPRDS